jgi:NADH-quinone oxidoreductase subunit H
MILLVIILLIKLLGIILPVLISVAYFTLLERKVMAGIQRRRGPDYIGFLGLLQPFSDGLKLFMKENFIPIKANKYLFIFAPILFLSVSLINWSLVPFDLNIVIADIHLGILYVLSLSSLSVYGFIIGGWASNSQYSFLGALRSAAQMISYEISIALILFTVIIFSQSLNLSKLVLAQKSGWFIFSVFPIFIMFFVCALAETSRPPFDLPEAEAELVSGYNVEYSSMGFAFFFIAEYMNIIFISVICTILFLGGWLPPINWFIFYIIPSNVWLSIKIIIIIFMFIWIRASFPRFRFDQLMVLTWRVFLPVSFSFFFLALGISEVYKY